MTTLTWGFFCEVPDEVLNEVFPRGWFRIPKNPWFASPYQDWILTEKHSLDNIRKEIYELSVKLKEKGKLVETVKISTSLSGPSLSRSPQA